MHVEPDARTVLGLVAAACTTVAFLPQVVKNWRTKSAGDLSFGMFGLFTIGVVLWLVYGVLIENLPIIAANMVTLVLNVINLVQMVRYRHRGVPGKKAV
ncbi:MAG: sugar transporter SemiSWEET [Rhodothermaceae bacterium]|nr:MAG: sugar transporter SemiSWEET [Rhodothermaceae bacterium]